MDYCNITYCARNCINSFSRYVQYNWAARGGWERWFQGVFAPFLFFNNGVIIDTEDEPKLRPGVNVRQSGQKVDLILFERNEMSYVELKCIPFTVSAGCGNIHSFLNGVYNDWKKLYYRSANNLISLVLIPNDLDGNGATIKNLLIMSANNCGFNYCINSCTYNDDIYMYVCGFNVTYNLPNNENVLNL